MADLWVAYDPAKEPGDRLAPEVVDEIEIIAQAGVDSVIGSADIEDGAVTTPKIADLAVTAPKLASNAVTTSKIAGNSISSDKLGPGAVTPAKVGAGVVTSHNIDGGDLRMDVVPVTAEQYAAIPNPDVNTLYLITDGNSSVEVPGGGGGGTGGTGPQGPAGPAGPQGPAGADGAPGPAGPEGPQGQTGLQGAPGLGIRFVGEVATLAELPTTGNVQGDLYVLGNRDDDTLPAESYIWDETQADWLYGGRIQGPQGVEGKQGPAGPKGDAGADGAPGVDGATGPQGPAGDAGVQGDTGAQGPAGADGAPGADGAKGDPGADGATGPEGPAGADGAPGADGAKGDQGEPGIQGEAGVQGVPGEQGPAGLGIRYAGEVASVAELPTTGNTNGDLWVIGNRDDDSKPAESYVWDEAQQDWIYAGAIQGVQGVQGVQGEAGPKGDQGIPGNDGAAGPAGADGATGPTGPAGPSAVSADADNATTLGTDGLIYTPLGGGAVGPQGPAGPEGPEGPAGADGAVGPAGADGAPGADGATGPAGPSAVSADAGNTSVLGSDNLIYTPAVEAALMTALTKTAFPPVGDSGKVYLAEDTGDTFRFDATARGTDTYVRIAENTLSTRIEDSTQIGRDLVTAETQSDARATIGAISGAGARAQVLGMKLRGGNITVKPGWNWRHTWAEWDWDNWIRPQVDRAHATGLNAIRFISGVRTVNDTLVSWTAWAASTAYTADTVATKGGKAYQCVTAGTSAASGGPSGTGASITDGTVVWKYMREDNIAPLTQEQYNSRWDQLAEYCDEKGMSLYPCICTVEDFNAFSIGDFQNATVTAAVVSSAEALSKHPNVIGFDLFQEGHDLTGRVWTGSKAYYAGTYINNGGKSYKCLTSGTSAATGGPTGTAASITDGTVVWKYEGIPLLAADVLALMAAIRKVCRVPLTTSAPTYLVPTFYTGEGWYGGSDTLLHSLVHKSPAGSDFVDAHSYRSDITPDQMTTFAALYGKPMIIGEFGTNQAAAAAEQSKMYTAIKPIHAQFGLMGTFVWAMADQGIGNAVNKAGFWDNTGFVQQNAVTAGSPLSITSGARTSLVSILREFSSAQTAADLVTLNGIQTLTNKTLNSAVLSTPRLNSVKDPNGNSFMQFGYSSTSPAACWLGVYTSKAAGVESTNQNVSLVAASDTATNPNCNMNLITPGTGWVEIVPATGTVARISAGALSTNPDKQTSLNLTSRVGGTVQANGVPVVTGTTATGTLPLSLWTGTKAQYDAILTKNATTIYVVSSVAVTTGDIMVDEGAETGDIAAEPVAEEPVTRSATTKSTRKK